MSFHSVLHLCSGLTFIDERGAIADAVLPSCHTTVNMSLPKFPTEVWVIVFEQLKFPKSICVIRAKNATPFERATRMYEVGQFHGALNLPEFERSKWLQLRQYYNIDKSTREAAIRAKLSERWFNSFEHVLNILKRPGSTAIRRCRKSSTEAYDDSSVWHQPSFHGNQTPIYIALNLYNIRPWETARAEVMNRAKNNFIDFAVDNPVFSTLRQIDLIVCVPREEESIARRYLDVLVKCVNDEWDGLGVRDGVVRVFWEIMPEAAELDSGVLVEMMEEEAEEDKLA